MKAIVLGLLVCCWVLSVFGGSPCTKTGTYYACADETTYVKCVGTVLSEQWYCPECVVSTGVCDSIAPPISVVSYTAPNMPGMPGHNTEILPSGEPGTYELAISKVVRPWPTLWVPLSNLNKVAKISTTEMAVKQIFYTIPNAASSNPSRTTVDLHGNVWVGNRNDNTCLNKDGKPYTTGTPYCGSATHIGLLEAGQCVDRNGNGKIDTSRNSSHLMPWTVPSGSYESTSGTPRYATDECLLHYIKIPYGTGVRHISITPDNNVWVGSYYAQSVGDTSRKYFYKVDSTTGETIPGVSFTASCGGYGGATSSSNVVGSAGGLLIYNPSASVPVKCVSLQYGIYGMTVDKNGCFWGGASYWIQRYHPNGTRLDLARLPGDITYVRGMSVDKNNDIWMALGESNKVARFNFTSRQFKIFSLNSGLCNFPMGVSIDQDLYVWAPCYYNGGVARILPNGTDSDTKYIKLPSGSCPYTYSDMTGFVGLNSMKPWGLWQFVIDSKTQCMNWIYFTWNEKIPKGSELFAYGAWAETSTALTTPTTSIYNRKSVTSARGRYMSFEMRLGANYLLQSPTLSSFTFYKRNITLPLLTGLAASVSCNTITVTLAAPALACGTWTGYVLYAEPGPVVKAVGAVASAQLTGLRYGQQYKIRVAAVHSSGQQSPVPLLLTATTAAADGCSCGKSQADCARGTFVSATCTCACPAGWTGDWCDVADPDDLSSSYQPGSTWIESYSLYED